MTLYAQSALTPDGWLSGVSIDIDDEGRIASVLQTPAPRPDQMAVGHIIPAPVNVHSHAFQRAMAGLTEYRGKGQSDSFWTWRRLMYRFLDQLTPDQIGAIAAIVQMEMLEAGYATNVEFHYLHHQPGGTPYADLAELSRRVVEAARQTGIGLTLLPVHYQYGGCDQRPLADGQRRFGNDLDRFQQLVEGAADAVKTLPADSTLGIAPHSLRAVGQGDLAELSRLLPDAPMHMHLAEQIAEVEEVQAAWGKRPVEWALDNLEMDPRWCLIHCTQMEPHETRGLAEVGAVAGLCPITESSLGDGIFDGVNWLAHGGVLAIGSDSNIRISLSEELRTLEYSQRLRDHSRAALASEAKSTARRMLDEVTRGGAQAAGRDTGAIAPGKWADLTALDAGSYHFIGRSGDGLLDSFVFAGDDRLVTDVWAAGRHVVQSGRHVERDRITQAYASTLQALSMEI